MEDHMYVILTSADCILTLTHTISQGAYSITTFTVKGFWMYKYVVPFELSKVEI